MTSTNTYAAPLTDSMPIPMAVEPKPSNNTNTTVASPKQAEAKAAATKRDRAFFAQEIQKATFVFYRSAKAVADVLLDARLTLSPDEFQKFIHEDCQFTSSLVYKFIKMAADYRLNDPKNQLLLPEEWTLRYEIMMMAEKTFRIGVTKGIIHRNCKLSDLKQLREQLETPKRKKATAKAKAKGKDSSAAAAKAEGPEPQANKAAVKAPINTSGLRVEAKASNGEPATATAMAPVPAKGYIKIVLPKEVAEQHEQDLVRIVDEIQALVKHYDFIGGVGLEVAA